MQIIRIVAPALAIAASTAAARGDVNIISRLSELHDSYSTVAPSPPSYDDNVSSTALGAVTLTTAHGATFTSNVTGSLITAQLHGGTSSGPSNNPYGSGTRTSLTVIFQVVGSPVDITILLNGSSFPIGNARLQLTNNVTSQVLFNSSSIVTTIPGFPPEEAWTNATWTSTLAPGTYRITGVADGTSTYSHGGGSGGGGGGSMNLQITFTPTPGAAAAFALLGCAATRRRRT